MANHNLFVPILLKHEGGFSNDPNDKGCETMKGVTLKTFRKYYGDNRTVDDLKNITDAQWAHIFKVGYWDVLNADLIQSQTVAEFLVDFGYNSGPTRAAKRLQRILGLREDGVIGKISLAAINGQSPLSLFGKMKKDRIAFINHIINEDPSQDRFRKGWMSRINSFIFKD